MKIAFRVIISLFFILLITAAYLSIIGVETDRLNTQIENMAIIAKSDLTILNVLGLTNKV